MNPLQKAAFLQYQLGRRADHTPSTPKSGPGQTGPIQGPVPAEGINDGGPASGHVQGEVQPDQTRFTLPDVTPEKAAKILEDGDVNGKPLTDRQRGAFGAVSKMSHREWDMILQSRKKVPTRAAKYQATPDAIERYAEQIGPKSKGQPEGTRWITVNKDSDPGTPILIDADGKIVGGPASLKGRQMRDLKGTKDEPKPEQRKTEGADDRNKPTRPQERPQKKQGDATPVSNVRGGRGRFKDAKTIGDIRAKLRKGESIHIANYKHGTQLEVRRPTSGTHGRRGIVATAELADDPKKSPEDTKPTQKAPQGPTFDRDAIPGRENINKIRWLGKQLGAEAGHQQKGREHTYWLNTPDGERIAQATVEDPKQAVKALAKSLDPKHLQTLEQAVAKKKKAPRRKQARGTQKTPRELAAAIRQIVGDDAKSRRDFVNVVNEVWKPKAEAVQAENNALRQLLGQFGMNASRIGSFLQKVKHAKDPDAIKRFDELTQYVKDHPEIAGPLLGGDGLEGGDNIEADLWERLSTPNADGKLGLARVPKRHDRDILDEATELAAEGGFFDQEQPEQEQDDDDYVPFSLRTWKVNADRDMTRVLYTVRAILTARK